MLEKNISYAAATWFSKLQKSHGLSLLSAIKALCLLMVSRAYKKTSTATLRVLTGTLPLNLKLEKITIQGCVLRLGKPMATYYPQDYPPKHIPTYIPPYQEYFLWIEDDKPPIDLQIQIYTDGSKMETGTAYAFCIYQQDHEIYYHQTKLRDENSIFQAELLAILEAIIWSEKSKYTLIQINSDSLSSLQAIEDINTHNSLIADIIHRLQITEKRIYFKWVKSYVGITGNERADYLAKNAIEPSTSIKEKFYPTPQSTLKWTLKNIFLQKWQEQWNEEYRGRNTYQLCPRVSEEMLVQHRNLYLFTTNHGPFPTYLYLFNKTPSHIANVEDWDMRYTTL